MGIAVIHSIGRGGRGPKMVHKSTSIKKNNNNLECPNCFSKLDRDDPVWSEDKKINYGMCPFCFKWVKFNLINPVGRPIGSVNEKKKRTYHDLALAYNRMFKHAIDDAKKLTDACRYLTIEDIVNLTGSPATFVFQRRQKLNYTSHRGKKTPMEDVQRRAVLIAINSGYIPPDLQEFYK